MRKAKRKQRFHQRKRARGAGQGKKKNNSNPGNSITDDAEVVKLVNYNTQLRFPCGLTDDARIYQYIDRDFFWSSEDSDQAFKNRFGYTFKQNDHFDFCNKMNQSLKILVSILLGFLFVNYAFSYCNQIHIVNV